jgi:hypothetical protein
MNGWIDGLRRGWNPRATVLLAALVLTLLWVHSLDVRQRAMRARSSAAAVPSAYAPAASPGDTTKTYAPEAWGHDPFEPRFGEARR